jgi:hypothetical protein
MKFISRLFWLFCAALSMLFAFAKAAFYLQKAAFRVLKLPNGALMEPRFRKRFKHYFFGTTYLSLLFCTYHGRRRHASDLGRFALLSALTCYFDDLTDAQQNKMVNPEWLITPESYGRATDPAGLALHFLHSLYHDLPPGQLAVVKRTLNRVFKLETDSRDSNSLAVRQELGASSVLLFRQLLDWPLSAQEEKTWMYFGAFIQMCDDIFDIWHDQNKHIETPVLTLARANDLEKIIHLFDSQEDKLKINFAVMPRYWRAHLVRAQIHWLSGMTRFCLLRYKKLWIAHGELPLQNRKLMVTDMGLWRNRWGAVWETIMPDVKFGCSPQTKDVFFR